MTRRDINAGAQAFMITPTNKGDIMLELIIAVIIGILCADIIYQSRWYQSVRRLVVKEPLAAPMVNKEHYSKRGSVGADFWK